MLTKSQKWGTGKVRPEQGILKLRKELGTFGNLRPCFFASDSLVDSSPLKAENVRGVNFNIIRELTGGIYFGERKEDEGDGKAMDTEPYSVEEIERVVRLAGSLASAENPPVPVWSLDKANVLATSRLWRKTFERIMKDEYPHLKSGTHLIDSAAMLMIKNPRALNGVVVTSNLFGDIISDEASVIPGSLGLLPSASLGGIPDGKTKLNGIYEPIHGMFCTLTWGLRLLIKYRFRARYCWPGHREPHCDYPVHQYDVQVLTVPARACAEDRRGNKNHH
jgi:3-isopropylmalate dehydrogenase